MSKFIINAVIITDKYLLITHIGNGIS